MIEREYLLEIIGEEGHGSMPHLAKNALYVLALLIPEIKCLPERICAAGELADGPVAVTLLDAQAGSRENIVPGKGSLRFLVSSGDAGNADRLENELDRLRAGYAEAFAIELQLKILH